MTGARLRIAVLIDNLGPYHVARVAGAAALHDMVVIEASPTRSEYAWRKPALPAGIGYIPLAHAEADRTFDRADLHHALDAAAPHAIALPGWSSVASLRCLRWAHVRRVPAILMSETNAWDFRRRSAIERLKNAMIAYFATALTTSDSQVAYLTALGMAPDAVFRGYDVVDNDYFAAGAARARTVRRFPPGDGARPPEGAFGRCFLSSARFVEKKNLHGLLAGYASFRRGRPDDPADWPLMLLGDGPLRGDLVRLRASLGLDAHVHLPGFVQVEALPDYYGAAGAFVLASRVEQWGLVVNEAMASALPVAVSRRCGCAEVLVEEGVTGVTFDPDDPLAIARAMATLAGLPDLDAMGRAAQRRVTAWGPARFADGLDRAARRAIAAGQPHVGLASRLALAAAIAHRAAVGRGLIRPAPNG